MLANVNPATGIRYGVTSKNDELVQHIMDNGTDETFENHKAECIKIIAAALEECGQDADNAESIVDDFSWEYYQQEEPSYSLIEDGFTYQLGWLGGAPLVWVISGPRIVYVDSRCSPLRTKRRRFR